MPKSDHDLKWPKIIKANHNQKRSSPTETGQKWNQKKKHHNDKYIPTRSNLIKTDYRLPNQAKTDHNKLEPNMTKNIPKWPDSTLTDPKMTKNQFLWLSVFNIFLAGKINIWVGKIEERNWKWTVVNNCSCCVQVSQSTPQNFAMISVKLT